MTEIKYKQPKYEIKYKGLNTSWHIKEITQLSTLLYLFIGMLNY